MEDSVFDSEEDAELDHRIKSELEALNFSSESINKLENEVQKARNKFRNLKSESSQQLNALYKKIGRRFIIKTRPYYDLIQQCNKSQVDVHRASVNFQKANGMYKAAKETVSLAECHLVSEDGHTIRFDSAWQELLNHANLKFSEAEKEKRACEEEHLRKAAEYSSLTQKMAAIYNDMPRAIAKAKPFYELKKSLESRLKAERQNAEDLHLALFCSKQKYKMALQSLEQISIQVHQQRQVTFNLPMRTPGVGAECDTLSQVSEMPSANLDIMSEAGSTISTEDMLDLDIELSMQDLEATEYQSADESSFDFWSKLSSRLKASASAAALRSTAEDAAELTERHRTVKARNHDEYDQYDRRSSASDFRDKSEQGLDSSCVRRNFVRLDDRGAVNRGKVFILDKTEGGGGHERRDTLKPNSYEQMERRYTLRPDDDEGGDGRDDARRDTLIPGGDEDRRRTITADNLDASCDVYGQTQQGRAKYNACESRKTPTDSGISGVQEATGNSCGMPQRESMVEGAEDSTPKYDDLKLKTHTLTYNQLNDVKHHQPKGEVEVKIAGKPPVPPPFFFKSGVQNLVGQKNCIPASDEINKFQDLSISTVETDSPTQPTKNIKSPKNEDIFV